MYAIFSNYYNPDLEILEERLVCVTTTIESAQQLVDQTTAEWGHAARHFPSHCHDFRLPPEERKVYRNEYIEKVNNNFTIDTYLGGNWGEYNYGLDKVTYCYREVRVL